jgi:hypothetical protein
VKQYRQRLKTIQVVFGRRSDASEDAQGVSHNAFRLIRDAPFEISMKFMNLGEHASARKPLLP